MSDADYEDVIKRLLELRKQFNELTEEFEKQSPNKEWIIAKYRLLKEKLRSEYKLINTNKWHAQASEVEECFYFWAITETYIELKYRIGARPCKEMLDCLYSAEDYISYYLEQIPSGKSNVVKPDKNKGPNPFDQL